MKWKITYYSEKLQEEILALPDGIQARFLFLSDKMEIYGPNLGMPHTRALKDGLFELRLKSSEGIGRVFYFTLSGREIKMLHCFVKKTQKTPPKEIKIARKRMKEKKNADA
jgi:phage-related protein